MNNRTNAYRFIKRYYFVPLFFIRLFSLSGASGDLIKEEV
jgi:hypothetical protein